MNQRTPETLTLLLLIAGIAALADGEAAVRAARVLFLGAAALGLLSYGTRIGRESGDETSVRWLRRPPVCIAAIALLAASATVDLTGAFDRSPTAGFLAALGLGLGLMQAGVRDGVAGATLAPTPARGRPGWFVSDSALWPLAAVGLGLLRAVSNGAVTHTIALAGSALCFALPFARRVREATADTD